MAAFDAWRRRRTVERLERQEDLHVAALYSNTNLDDEKNDRATRVKQLQEYYEALRRSAFGETVSEEDIPDEHRDAFMRASKRAQAMVAPPELPGEEAIQKLPA